MVTKWTTLWYKNLIPPPEGSVISKLSEGVVSSSNNCSTKTKLENDVSRSNGSFRNRQDSCSSTRQFWLLYQAQVRVLSPRLHRSERRSSGGRQAVLHPDEQWDHLCSLLLHSFLRQSKTSWLRLGGSLWFLRIRNREADSGKIQENLQILPKARSLSWVSSLIFFIKK